MIAARVSRFTLRLVPWALALSLVAGGPACNGGGGSGGSPPVLSNLQVYPPSAALNDGAGTVAVSMSANVSDSGADVSRMVITVRDPSGAQVNKFSGDVTNPPGMTQGTIGGTFPLSTAAVTTFTLQFQVFDAGGSGSNILSATFPVVTGNPVPTLSSISPASAAAGGPGFTLTVTGADFMTTSSVLWNGSYLTTTYVDATTLTAQVPSSQIYWAGTASVTVVNPPPGGGMSAALTFTVNPPPPNPAPVLTSISPASVEAGTPSVTLTATGSDFVASSQILWNGFYVSTTFVDATTLTATVSGSYLQTVGTVPIRVYTPSPGGGTSSSLPFAVTRPVRPGVTFVSLQANDILWDPYQQRIYASVPSASAVNPNTVSVVDPFTGTITGSQFAGSEPGRLAASDDGQFLYVALGGAASVSQLSLPSLARGADILLGRDPTYGAYYALDLAVAPSAPNLLAVSLTTKGTFNMSGGIAVFDGGTQLPNKTTTASTYYSMEWGATAGTLYATTSSYPNALYVVAVDASGAAIASTYGNVFTGYTNRIHFDPVTGLLYGDDGHAVDPATGLPMGTFSTGLYSQIMTPDSSLGSAFFVGSQSYGSSPALVAFDLTRFSLTGTMSFPYFSSPAGRIVRWGPDGVAFIAGNEVVLVRGAIVLPVSATPNPAPTVSALTPSSVAAGGPNLRLLVTGTGFVPGSVVSWAGSDRFTQYVSPTQLLAYIPASDVAAAGTPSITVTSPAPGGGTSAGTTFTVN